MLDYVEAKIETKGYFPSISLQKHKRAGERQPPSLVHTSQKQRAAVAVNKTHSFKPL